MLSSSKGMTVWDETGLLGAENRKDMQPKEEQSKSVTHGMPTVEGGTTVPTAGGKRSSGTEVGAVSLSLPDPDLKFFKVQPCLFRKRKRSYS